MASKSAFIKLLVTLSAVLGVSAIPGAPARADMSCHDFTRAYVLNDQDGIKEATTLAAPWIQANAQLLDSFQKHTGPASDRQPQLFNFLTSSAMSHIADDCRSLPDESVGSIVTTLLKNTRQQIAELEVSPKPAAEAGKPPMPASGQASADSHLPGKDLVALSVDQQLSNHMRDCMSKDAGAPNIDNMQVLLTVTTDASGAAHRVEVAGSDVGRLGDPRFRAFAERAVRAVLDPRCGNLPLPKRVPGRTNVMTFRFSP